MSSEWVKLDTTDLLFRLILTNTSVCVVNYPQMRCVQGDVTSSSYGKMDNILAKGYLFGRKSL